MPFKLLLLILFTPAVLALTDVEINANKNIYKSMDANQKKDLMLAFYTKYIEGINANQKEMSEFSKKLAEVSSVVSNNISNSYYLQVELPGFTFKDPEAKINNDNAYLKSNIMYLVDFKKKTITKDGELEINESSKNNVAYIAYNSITNTVLIRLPYFSKSIRLYAVSLSANEIIKQINKINPYFNFHGVYEQ
jgi:hypothetical protein